MIPKIIVVLSFIIAVFFIGCLPDQSAASLVDTMPKVLKKVVKKHSFSSNTTEDTFSLVLLGTDVSTATVTFEITNNAGETLYKETFPSEALIDYGILDVSEKPTNQDRIDYIVKRMDTFFEPKDFSKPAIKPTADYEPQYSNKKIWDDIKSDPTAVGLDYLLYEENGHSITYSKKLKKVVEYFSCC